jgi:hypothetical protein
MTKKIIVVFGATGKSGGGMINYILDDGTFAARAVTRNTDSDKAKGMQHQAVYTPQVLVSPSSQSHLSTKLTFPSSHSIIIKPVMISAKYLSLTAQPLSQEALKSFKPTSTIHNRSPKRK